MSSHDVTVAGYAIVAAAALGLEVASLPSSSNLASIRQVVGRVSRSRAGRVGVLTAWAWLGMHFLAR